MSGEERVPPVRQIREVGVAGLHRLRDSTARALSDFTPTTGEDEFAIASEVRHLGNALVFDNRMTGARLDRKLSHVAGSGMDHYQVRWVIEGAYHSTCRGRSIAVGPGSINVCDTSEAEQLYIVPAAGRALSRSIVWYLARPLLAPWLSNPDAVGSALVSGGTPYGALLHDHLVALWGVLPRLPLPEREAALLATVALVAGGVGGSSDAAEPLARARRDVRLAAIKRHVRDHLGADGLEIAALAARFGMSRAVLCRLFEPDGGVAHYVQRCRLDRAFATLTSNAHPRARVLDVALECRFESESSFIRAFRRRFGITPGELRKVAAPSSPEAERTPDVRAEVYGWLDTLSGTARRDVMPPSGGSTKVPPAGR